jgi:hypothetical protein
MRVFTGLEQSLHELAAQLPGKIQSLSVKPKKIHIEVCYEWPKKVIRSKTMEHPITDEHSIFEQGLALLNENDLLRRELRSITIGVTDWQSVE